MKKNDLFTYLLLSLSILVFSPGRLAYGLVLILEYNFILFFSIFLVKLISILNLAELKNICFCFSVIFLAVLFKLFTRLYSPMISFNLGILFYMPAISVILLENIYETTEKLSVAKALQTVMPKNLYFSLYALIFFILRDFFAYGSISLPCPFGVYNLFTIGNFKYSFVGVFFASIPGALCLAAVSYLLASSLIDRKAKSKID